MASVEDKLEITGEGLDSLDSLTHHLRQVIFQLAGTLAKERIQTHRESTQAIRIDSEDVRHAATVIADALKVELEKGNSADLARFQHVIECVAATRDE